jgi:predicted glycosyltransferase
MKRVLVFTHDTFGLGHVRRSLHIVRALCRRLPDAAVLLASGSPALRAVRDLPPNADFVKLPTIVKTGAAGSQPPHLPLELREVTSLRTGMLRGAVDAYRPDLLLVDNFPLGSRRELVEVLPLARQLGARTVLGLRDIVDRPEVVRASWTKDGVYDALQELYDLVLVYGVREILDAGAAYGLSSELQARVRYCGYVTAGRGPLRDAAELRRELGVEEALVVATVGGGGDGFPLLHSFVRAVGNLSGLTAVVVTGPLMAPGDRERIRELALGHPGILVTEYVEDLPSYLAAADAVVAMGGYNTVAELLALKRRALVLPRDWRYGDFALGGSSSTGPSALGPTVEWEQLLRAEALQRLGLVRVLPRECFEPKALATHLADALTAAGALAQRSQGQIADVDVGGAERAADELVHLLQSEGCHHAG